MCSACTYCIWEIGLMRLQTATMMLLWFPLPPRVLSFSFLTKNLLLMSHKEGVSSDVLFVITVLMLKYFSTSTESVSLVQ